MSSIRNVVIRLVILLTLIMQSHAQPTAFAQPGAANPGGPTRTWTFESDPIGGLPRGAVVFSGTWVVRTDADAPSGTHVLCQTGTATFPVLLLGDVMFTNVALSTRFKAISGREDRAAGLIFRVQDKDNYYIVRANALEDNVNIFIYAGGRRRVLKEGSASVPSGRWQTLRAEVIGPRIRAFLNDRLVVETTDSTFKSGKIGLWTKADSITCFDNVESKALAH